MGESRFREVLIVINPGAGKGEDVLRPINDVLHPAGVHWDVAITNGPGEATDHARAAVERGVDAVGVVGGDGTVAEVAEGLAGTEVPLAILPGGTGNGAAGEFGIPKDVSGAAALLTDPSAEVRAIDLGAVGDRRFLLRCGCGAIARVDAGATRELKSHIGGLAYVWSGLETLVDVQVHDYRVTCDGRLYEASGVTCIVANGGGFGRVGTLGEGISVDDGRLDVLVYSGERIKSPKRAVTELLPEYLGQRPPSVPPLCTGSDIVVETDEPEDVVVDGEPAGTTPLRAHILPHALRLLLPAST